VSERLEDAVRDALDIASGWCRPYASADEKLEEVELLLRLALKDHFDTLGREPHQQKRPTSRPASL